MKPFVSQCYDRNGFTLVEVVCTALISTLLILSIAGLIMHTLYATAFCMRNTEATQLAQERMEVLLESGDEMVGGSDEPPTNYLRTWTVEGQTDGGMAMEVEVSWRDSRGRTHQVTLNSLFYTNAPAGAAGLSFNNLPQIVP